jgi:hypothetical protein
VTGVQTCALPICDYGGSCEVGDFDQSGCDAVNAGTVMRIMGGLMAAAGIPLAIIGSRKKTVQARTGVQRDTSTTIEPLIGFGQTGVRVRF